jgi:hypothetical protein
VFKCTNMITVCVSAARSPQEKHAQLPFCE